MAATKKIPMRMCVGCREMRPKKELIRVVRNSEGVVSIDAKGKAPGRGAYLCPEEACMERAFKTKALERALEHKIEQAVFDKLRESITLPQAEQ
ncbi:YlxR family protein [Eubacteriales bacterium OttesenSCG-928-K08]|nr:YlxR family protein [Eubacteriales bacterium OttesenSCG-928-K08]